MHGEPDQSESPLTAAQLRDCDLDAVIVRSKKADWHHYFGAFAAEAKAREQQGDSTGARVFGFLATIASLSPQYDITEGGTDTRIGALDDAALDLLREVVTEISDPDLRALMADILWIRRRDHEAAKLAVTAYIASAELLRDPKRWPPAVDRLQRAVGLGAKLGKSSESFSKAIEAIERMIALHQEDDVGLQSDSLMSILLAQRTGDAARYSPIAESAALRLEEKGNWFFARQYWKQKSEWDRRRNESVAASDAELRAAQTYVKEGEAAAAESPPSSMRAAGLFAKGVEALRRAKAPREQVESAHQALRACQQKIPDEMTSVSLPDHLIKDLESQKKVFNEQARAIVKGRLVQDALLRLAILVSAPQRPADLRSRMQTESGQSVFTDLVPVSMITDAGLTAAVNPPLLGATEEEREAIIQKRIHQELLRTNWPIALDFQITPAVEQIKEEHAVRMRDFAFLVLDNPFVPGGREGLYARGLYAGFQGDFVVSTHLLIPQIENSIRVILQGAGVVTSTLSSSDVQEERDHGWLLHHDAISRCFQPEIAYHLRALLIERFGGNLRNEMAHGLISEPNFYSAAAYYLWWLTLRICAVPLVEFGDAQDS